MQLFLVPPHADFTLAWPSPPGFEPLDLARAFVQRALAPQALREASSRLEAALGSAGPDGPLHLLQLRAAIALLETPGDVHRHLRAAGAALAGLSAPPSPVRLTLDDLHLASGTTERSAEAVAASGPGAPWQPELDLALERCAGAAVVRLWLERDVQLPAVLFLAQRLASPRLQLAGPFARQHRAALSRLPMLQRCEWIDEPGALPVILGAPSRPAEPPALMWRESAMALAPEGMPWAGRIRLDELAAPERLAASGCRVAVLPFAAAIEAVLGAGGESRPVSEVEAAAAALRARGVALIGEWWLGAPGVDAAALQRTAERIERAPLFDRIAALRTFHWPSSSEARRWGAVEVRVSAPPADRDLARSHAFEAPATLSPAELAAQAEALAARLGAGMPLVPGRVAQAYVTAPTPPPPRGDRIALDPDCALVSLPISLEGEPSSSTYAANLRTGAIVKLDGLAPAVAALRSSASAADALAPLPAPQRALLLKALVAKSVLVEVDA